METKTTQNNVENVEISFEEIKESVKGIQSSEELDTQELKQADFADLKAKKILVEIQGYHDYFELRKDWSSFLMVLLFGSILFQLMVTICIGLKLLDYSQYQWFINLVMGENFLQIIGLCFIVVKFLFPQSPKK